MNSLQTTLRTLRETCASVIYPLADNNHSVAPCASWTNLLCICWMHLEITPPQYIHQRLFWEIVTRWSLVELNKVPAVAANLRAVVNMHLSFFCHSFSILLTLNEHLCWSRVAYLTGRSRLSSWGEVQGGCLWFSSLCPPQSGSCPVHWFSELCRGICWDAPADELDVKHPCLRTLCISSPMSSRWLGSRTPARTVTNRA